MSWHVFYVQFMFLYTDLLIKVWGVKHLAEVTGSSASGSSASLWYNYSSREDAMCFNREEIEWKSGIWSSFRTLPLANSVILIISPWNKRLYIKMKWNWDVFISHTLVNDLFYTFLSLTTFAISLARKWSSAPSYFKSWLVKTNMVLLKYIYSLQLM